MPETRSGQSSHCLQKSFSKKRMKLFTGGKVEVKSFDEGFIGSWHPGDVISAHNGFLTVLYDNLVREDDQEERLHENLPFSSAANGHIRPVPPKIDMNVDLDYSMCVDAFYNEAWWEGVVLDDKEDSQDHTIFFPDQGDEIQIRKDCLRLTQDWNETTCSWSVRGKWVFLDILREYVKDDIVPVSVKQLWYDVREKEKFCLLKAWASPLKLVWEQLVKEVLDGYTRLTAMEVLNNAKSSPEFEGVDDETLTQEAELGPCLMEEDDAETTVLKSSKGLELVVYSNKQRERQQLVVVSESPLDQENYASDDSEESCCLSSKTCDGNYASNSKNRSLKQWKPAPAHIVSGPKCLPNTVSEFLNRSRRPSPELVMNFRRHLLYLGWKIEYSAEEPCDRKRYISPQGKRYYSLKTVVESFKQDQVKHTSSLSESTKACGDFSIQPYLDNSVAVHNTDQKTPVLPEVKAKYSPQIVTLPEVKPEYCPQIVNEYLKHDNKKMAIKARRHLAALGWSFKVRHKTNKSVQWLYYSPAPASSCYSSIKTALESLHPKGSPIDCLPSSDPCEVEGRTTRLTSNDMPSTTNNQLQLSIVPLTSNPKEVVEDKLGNSGTLKFYVRKKGKRRSQPQKCSLSHSHDTLADGLVNNVKPGFSNNLALDILGDEERIFSDSGKLTQAVRSSKRVRELKSSNQNPLTVLSWLIENDLVLPRSKIYCTSGEEGDDDFLEGKICHDGIKCSCCNEVVSLGEFEAHGRSLYEWSVAHVFLENGGSLVDCQERMLKRKMKLSEEACYKKRKTSAQSGSDYICSVCHDGGTILLCDGCPSSFHTECVALMDVPEGDWFCPSCCCGVCGGSEFLDISGTVKVERARSCHQCERKYHVRCIPSGGFRSTRDDFDNRKWFCSRSCVKVYNGIQNILGKPIPVGPENNLTWTLLKSTSYEMVDWDDPDESVTSVENLSKLSLAVEVLHECFEPVKDSRTGRDLTEAVVFGRGSDLTRLNFNGFYTVLLQKNEAVISVAAVRIFGNRVAEVPLVGTRNLYRRLGMCRVLMNQLEKTLAQFGVEKLVLPAVSSVLNTWTGAFGFSHMPQSDRRELLPHIFMTFQDTVMCQKVLEENWSCGFDGEKALAISKGFR